MATETNKHSEHVDHIAPYSDEFTTMVPTGFVKFFRTCVIWQFIRFVHINIKMLLVVAKSH